MGRKLVALLQAAGVQPLRNTWVFFGSCSGNPAFEGFVENLAGVVLTARDTIVTAGWLDGAMFDETIRELRSWAKRPDAALWYGVSWAEGKKITSDSQG